MAIKKWISVHAVLLFLLECGVSHASHAQECVSLADAKRHEILSYASAVWKIGNSASLQITNENIFRDTCYRLLVIDGGNLKQPLTVVLSPDQRFLSSWLFDLSVSPEVAHCESAKLTKQLLLSENSPHRGIGDAPITLVEFGDFECPYCKQFNEWMSDLPSSVAAQTTLIYKHLPLSQHPWAHEAATAAICASFQSNEAFWKLHDFIFTEQERLLPSTAHDRMSAFLATLADVDMNKFESCMKTREAEKIIVRDAALARGLSVAHTPTIFLNGIRVEGMKSSDDLTRILLNAKAMATFDEPNPLPSAPKQR